ncbi:P-loop containing nucleoside triphosphate hydrolase protein [Schizopora paradoxa]|uniref:p-loop containing nucleoside triphosphate hydrolase protein n=1 Tax=Schizopora paradoxa TaxID=27342 RepID=A0A0H2S7R1_9AGAM|nr:P-loop containing nucleoside triphosphate hydrolase protein [Schizopora paradoxa]
MAEIGGQFVFAERIILEPLMFRGKVSVPLWANDLLFPAYLCALSALILLIHRIACTEVVRRLVSRLLGLGKLSIDREDSDDVQLEVVSSPHEGIVNDIKAHVASLGGPTIFSYKIVRLLGCLILVALTIATLIVYDYHNASGSNILETLKKHKGKKKSKSKKPSETFSQSEWVQIALCLAYAYMSLLALISVTAKQRWGAVANRHLVTVLLFTFAIFAYRDVWPLATYTHVPMDQAEGALLWVKFGILTVSALVVPLCIPRQYIPVDPKDPMEEVNPEQTASLFSLVLYFFLDSIIFKAYKIPHLTPEQLPPLADYDYSKNLVKHSFRYLDTFAGATKKHLFFGLMQVFAWEYVGIVTMTIVRVVTNFASPIGIKQLLGYLESGGEGAIIRPWVWISWLFLGPFIGSIAMQWYIFLTTGTLVRAEGVLTELIFEHALRIRMKAQVPPGTSVSAPTTAVATPDNASVVSADDENTLGNSTLTTDETVVASSSSVKSSSSKGKAKSSGESPTADKKPEESAHRSSTDNLTGKLNNLVTTDIQNIVEGRDFPLLIVNAPLMIGLGVWLLYVILDWSALVGMAVMVLTFPLPGYIAKLTQTTQIERMKKTDARVQTVTETMNVIRMIKLFGWEPKVKQEIDEKRSEELVWIKRRQYLDIINGVVNYIIPLMTMIITFFTYTVIMKRQLTASTVFSSMAVFDMLRDQLHIVVFMIPACIQAKVSLDRVSEFLNTTELLDEFEAVVKGEESDLIREGPEDKSVVGFHSATFSWSSDTDGSLTPSRRNFRLCVEDELVFKRGCINLIIGPTGSGKTSLLMALLGEMHFIPSGPMSWYNLPRDKGVAYASQESWVQNETIRDNILFGSPFDEERYNKVIVQCGLERDLTLFEAGDRTEVGEKGLTLSGGQKARVTLARAIYSNADVILLDDVLAALDVHTARWVVENCFKGDLVKGRTILLVTHNVAMTVPIAQYVVSLGIDGRVVSQGTVSETLAKDDEMRKEAIESELAEKKADEVEATEGKEEKKPNDGAGKLVMAEEVAEGHVSFKSVKLYLFNLGGIPFWVCFAGGILLCDMFNIIQTWWLGHWAREYEIISDPSSISVPYYLSVFAGFIAAGVTLYTVAYIVYVYGNIKASRTIHSRLIDSMTGATLRWLDSTPTGRIITRCTQDIRSGSYLMQEMMFDILILPFLVDGPIPQNLGWLVELTDTLILRFLAVVYFTPVFVIPGLAVGILGSWCGQIYIKAQLCVKRNMSNAKSPVMSHFGAAISGLISIRAYGAQDAFKGESLKRINNYTRSARTFYNLNRWVCIRIDFLSAVFASGLAVYLVYVKDSNSRTASDTGFSLNMAVAFSSMILWWVRILNEFEVNGKSLERIQGYIDIDHEPKPTPEGVPPAYWPSSGQIEVNSLSARYSKDGPRVLHDLSFQIKSGERVGVVGRTGSGKSSLTLSLLRCILTEGEVYYDSLPTSSINLDALRRNITIIPQVPELISGTLRHNLDPFSEHDDATLNDALRAAGLFSLQNEMDEGRITLDSAIASGGTNLSVGQRQILALARAIVRGSKLLILDEATSAIDYETDTVIQKSLRTELNNDVTLITIAHRLQTIMDSDKIMVLDAGRVVEFDTPENLLQKEGGRLKSLVDESGDKKALYAMAAKKGQGETSK